MPQKFDTRQKQRLLNEERYAALQPETFLRQLGLKEGDTLADIGCGPGFFTLPAAQIVGSQGLVYAADVQGDMLSAVRTRVADAELTNVRVVKTSDTEIPLPAASCDLALLAFMLHEVGMRASFLVRVARTLKPGARIALLEWVKEESPEGPPLDERISYEEVEADARAAGLRIEERRDLNPHQYLALLASARP